MKKCDNSKIHISSNFILSISLLIMFDSLLLRPSLHCNTSLHFTTLHPTTLHYTSLHFTTLCYTSHFTQLHFSTLQYTSLPFTTLHPTTLHYTLSTLHFLSFTLHYPFKRTADRKTWDTSLRHPYHRLRRTSNSVFSLIQYRWSFLVQQQTVTDVQPCAVKTQREEKFCGECCVQCDTGAWWRCSKCVFDIWETETMEATRLLAVAWETWAREMESLMGNRFQP